MSTRLSAGTGVCTGQYIQDHAHDHVAHASIEDFALVARIIGAGRFLQSLRSGPLCPRLQCIGVPHWVGSNLWRNIAA